MNTALHINPILLPGHAASALMELPSEASVLAKLHCPFITTLNPGVAAAEQSCSLWAQRFGLLPPSQNPPPRRLEFATLTALVYPGAAPELLQLGADWFTWLYLLDDIRDGSGTQLQLEQMSQWNDRVVQILRGAPLLARDHGFARALHDLRERIVSYGMLSTMDQFTADTQRYLAAIVVEADQRCHGAVPTLSSYQALRSDTGAVFTCLDLIGLMGGFELSESVWAHPTVRHLSLLANRIICCCNDILSVRKELRNGEIHNVVLVLQRERRLTLRAAMDQAISLHNQDVRDFMALSVVPPPFGLTGDHDLGRYIEGLRTWIRGNYEFSLSASRYKSARG